MSVYYSILNKDFLEAQPFIYAAFTEDEVQKASLP
jgi:hypothetical protein